MNPSKSISIGLLCIALFFTGLMAGKMNKRTKEVIKFQTDTLTIIRTDTIRIEKPVPYKITELRTDTIAVFHERDTVYVPIPIQAYQFKGDDYKLDLTGYNVEVRQIEVYPKTITKYITNETTRTITKRKRFGLGISAGYGFSRDGLSPYIGAGIQYNIIQF